MRARCKRLLTKSLEKPSLSAHTKYAFSLKSQVGPGMENYDSTISGSLKLNTTPKVN